MTPRVKTHRHVQCFGTFSTAEEAARSHDLGALVLFGDDAGLNFPITDYLDISTGRFKEEWRGKIPAVALQTREQNAAKGAAGAIAPGGAKSKDRKSRRFVTTRLYETEDPALVLQEPKAPAQAKEAAPVPPKMESTGKRKSSKTALEVAQAYCASQVAAGKGQVAPVRLSPAAPAAKTGASGSGAAVAQGGATLPASRGAPPTVQRTLAPVRAQVLPPEPYETARLLQDACHQDAAVQTASHNTTAKEPDAVEAPTSPSQEGQDASCDVAPAQAPRAASAHEGAPETPVPTHEQLPHTLLGAGAVMRAQKSTPVVAAVKVRPVRLTHSSNGGASAGGGDSTSPEQAAGVEQCADTAAGAPVQVGEGSAKHSGVCVPQLAPSTNSAASNAAAPAQTELAARKKHEDAREAPGAAQLMPGHAAQQPALASVAREAVLSWPARRPCGSTVA